STTPSIRQLSPPTLGTAAADASGSGGGPTGLDAGTYSYKILFVDPNAPATNQEGPPSLAFPTPGITTDGTQSITLNALPASPDISVYTKMRIYRADSSGTYKLAGEINAVGTGTTSFTDDVPTASLTTTLDSDSFTDLGAAYNYFVTFANANLESRPTLLS